MSYYPNANPQSMSNMQFTPKDPSYVQYNQQPAPAPVMYGPRLLHIYINGLTHRKMTIFDNDKQTALYTIKQNQGMSLFSEKPHMKIFRGLDTNVPYVGSASFHGFSQSVDLGFHGRMEYLHADSLFKRTHSFNSSVGRLSWKGDGIMSNNLKLVDQQDNLYARFDNAAFSMSKEGKLEIYAPNAQGMLLDEIVTSGLAMIQCERRRRNNNSGSIAASSS